MTYQEPRKGVRNGDDLLVEGNVLIELKAVGRLLPEHKAQVINYLNATGIGVGMLMNFGDPRGPITFDPFEEKTILSILFEVTFYAVEIRC